MHLRVWYITPPPQLREHSLQGFQLVQRGKGLSLGLGFLEVVVVVVEAVDGASLSFGNVNAVVKTSGSSAIKDLVAKVGAAVVHVFDISLELVLFNTSWESRLRRRGVWLKTVGNTSMLASPITLLLIELVSFSVNTSLMLEFWFAEGSLFMRHSLAGSKDDFHLVYLTFSALSLCRLSHSWCFCNTYMWMGVDS